ncbi:insulin-degrading enzyme-like 1, peroxisomal isoform X1 [Solanum pennellii]|uniref:Insulin-degrading enzyme-like 1, peroxisomal isoform X1 n=1 Tax=Solanum pennellii TaxID=28526 RepID=A0ABM1GNE9_SOLPN|nr:insulin-degrading enzyme-like 1, peroxisomal isoform X1 [Solanum pennellii]
MAVGKADEPVEIFKARSDKREYRRIVLQNSLEVLLITDPETDKCAASMEVSVGYYSDPKGLEGLAHFLEHMLFYASEKYPVENSYSKYITQHGGSTNAFTSSERTNFYFDINADCFEEALDRFAQFFVKPLMSPDATTREIKAVDSENQNNLLSDGHRVYQLQKHLSSKDHPYHKFGTGNWDTLEVQPKARGLNTRQELLKFYKENYSANLMHLVVYAKDCLDKAQTLVQSIFQEVPNTNRSYSPVTDQPCKSEHLQILVRAVPIKQGHSLRLEWPIIPDLTHYKEGPSLYLSHLIGHEGEGSLFYILKKLGWATSLSAGESGGGHHFSFFEVYISLTDAGHEHFEDVVALVFKYIHLLQQAGARKWIFDELSAISETNFHYQDKSSPIGYVVYVASNMQLYPPIDWLVGSSLPSKFSPDIIEAVLNDLTPQNVRIFWVSTNFDGNTDSMEPWYETAYSLEKITSSVIEQWMEKAPDGNLHLPVPNMFIPTDLSIKTVSNKMNFPVLLRKSSYSRLWYKPDTLFSMPKGYCIIDFICPQSRSSPESAVLTCIFVWLLKDYLNEYAYDAEIAGLGYWISGHCSGFEVTVSGYNHKMRILLEKVIDRITNFKVEPDRFFVIKELFSKQYQNIKFQQPYEQALYYCSLILREHSWSWNDECEALTNLEIDDLVKFYPLLLSRTFLECYVAGNIDSKEAVSMIQHVEDALYKGSQPLSRALFASEHSSSRIINLEESKNYFYAAEGLNTSDENSALVHYIQVHSDEYIKNVKLQLFALIAKQPAFDQLRSVEQLGYITSLSRTSDAGVRGLQLIVQSSVKDPRYIESRFQAFLKTLETQLHDMSDDEFKKKVNALIDIKLEKFKNLPEETNFFWWEISSGTLKFDRIENEVAALKQITKMDLIDFFNEYVNVGAPKRKSLSLQVFGSSHFSEFKSEKVDPAEPNVVQIEDIFCFRRSRPLHHSLKGDLVHLKAHDIDHQ